MTVQLKTDASQAAVASMIETLTNSIATLTAVIEGPCADDLIFGWDYGLGVRFEGAAATVCSIEAATAVFVGKSYPTVTNGKGELATARKRGNAAKAELEKLEKIVSDLDIKI